MTLTIDGVDYAKAIDAGSGPIVTRTENGGDMLTVSLLNGSGPDNFLSADYVVMGGRHAPMSVNQKLEYSNEYGVTFFGFVSAIAPKGEVVSVTAVDAVRVLSKRGSTLYRNYYGGVSRKSCRGGFDGGLYLEVPNNANVQEADWATNQSLEYKDGDQGFQVEGIETIITTDAGNLDIITSMSVYVKGTGFADTFQGSVFVTIDATSEGHYIGTYRGFRKSKQFERVDLQVKKPTPVYNNSLTIKVMITKGYYTYSEVRLSDRAGSTVTRDGVTTQGKTIYTEIEGMKYVPVQGQTIGTQYMLTPSTASGYPDVNDPSEAVPDFPERGRVYYSTPDGMSNTAIMGELIRAGGFTPDIAGPTVPVTEFRASGGYIGDYLSALSDLPDANGNQAVYYSDDYTIRVRKRNGRFTKEYAQLHTNLPDLPPATAEGEKIIYPIAGSFEVRRALIGKPSVVMVKGTKTNTGEAGNGTPIMFAVSDPDSWDARTGTDAVRVSSSSNDYVSVAREAYGEVMRNRSKDWEGVVTVSGLHPGLIAEGSGTSVRVFDDMSGLYDEWMRAREIVLDCANMTTAITLNNHGIRMNNPVRDSETMGLKTANLSVDNLSLDNYTLQFVRVVSDYTETPKDTGNTMSVRLRRSETEVGDVTVPVDAIVTFAETGETIVHATFPAGTGYENIYPHAVQYVRLNDGPWTEIPEYIRPDKKASQTLIVNLVI